MNYRKLLSAHSRRDQDNCEETVFRFLAEPASVNFGGKIHGGLLMKWIDETAYVVGTTSSGSRCVTVSVGNIQFRRSVRVRVRDLVEPRARVITTEHTVFIFT